MFSAPFALPTAAQAPSGAASMLPMLLLLVGVLVLFWFMSRNQRKRQQQAMSFRDRLQVGQEVVTIGRLVGTITWIDGDQITIESTPGSSFKVMRNGIASLVEPDEPDEPEESTHEADGASVVTEAEAVVKEAGHKDVAPAADDSDKGETIMLNGEEVARKDLEDGGDEKKKGKK